MLRRLEAHLSIPVATAQSAMKLLNTALRYKPPMTPKEILALYNQYGIDQRYGQRLFDGIQKQSSTRKPCNPLRIHGLY